MDGPLSKNPVYHWYNCNSPNNISSTKEVICNYFKSEGEDFPPEEATILCVGTEPRLSDVRVNNYYEKNTIIYQS